VPCSDLEDLLGVACQKRATASPSLLAEEVGLTKKCLNILGSFHNHVTLLEDGLLPGLESYSSKFLVLGRFKGGSNSNQPGALVGYRFARSERGREVQVNLVSIEELDNVGGSHVLHLGCADRIHVLD